MDLQRTVDNLLERLRGRTSSRHRPEPARPSRPQLNEQAPDFEADTTHGKIRLSTWGKDKWVILFSHPADFTPVCTTEFVALARLAPELQRRNTLLLGSSIDSVYAHIAWTRNIKEKLGIEIPFPIIADRDMSVARRFGMLHDASSDTDAVRAMYFIDPKRTLRAMIYYPLDVGRNTDEVLRILEALQMADETGLAAPAGWRPGQPAMVPAPRTVEEAEERLNESGVEATDWYYAKKTA